MPCAAHMPDRTALMSSAKLQFFVYLAHGDQAASVPRGSFKVSKIFPLMQGELPNFNWTGFSAGSNRITANRWQQSAPREGARVWDDTGTFRFIYLAKLTEAIYVLHWFRKKTEQTSEKDIRLARAPQRFNQGETDMSKQRQFASVWDAIEDTPQQAASMRARSEVLIALQEWVKTR